MNLNEIYRFAVDKGMEVDIRGRAALDERMRELAGEYEGLSDDDKALFDVERLKNPFGDTRIVCGDATKDLKRVMVGVDIHGQEILAAKMLSDQGPPIDAIIAHHMSALGKPLASVADTMAIQVDMMTEVGVPLHAAEKLLAADVGDRGPGEDYRHGALADLLGMPIAAIHTPADNYLMYHVRKIMAEGKPRKVKDMVAILRELPESKVSMKRGIAPRSLIGAPNDSVGDKIYYCLGGGWNPTPAVFKTIAEAGVGTVLLVAATPDLEEIAKEYHMNLVCFPHYPADSLGINLLLDELLKETPLDIVPCSNFDRIERG